jgi:hypothetical protein
MTTVEAVVKVTVDVCIDAKNTYDAEKVLNDWFRNIEDDERLHSYDIRAAGWIPIPV